MRKKMLFILFSVVVMLAVAVGPVGAITGNNWVNEFRAPLRGAGRVL